MAGNGAGFQSSTGFSGGGDSMDSSQENDRQDHDPASSGLFGVDFKRSVSIGYSTTQFPCALWFYLTSLKEYCV